MDRGNWSTKATKGNMSPTPYTEDTLVPAVHVEYLRNELGWKSLYAYNNEDFAVRTRRFSAT